MFQDTSLYITLIILPLALGAAARVGYGLDPRSDKKPHQFTALVILVAAIAWILPRCGLFSVRDEGPGLLSFMVVSFAAGALLAAGFLTLLTLLKRLRT